MSSTHKLTVFLAASTALLSGPGYHVTTKIQVGGQGGWDYLIADSARHRLFVSHGNQVDVVDTVSAVLAGRKV